MFLFVKLRSIRKKWLQRGVGGGYFLSNRERKEYIPWKLTMTMEKQSFEEVSPIKKCRWFYQLAIFVFETSRLSSATEVMTSRTKDHLIYDVPRKKDKTNVPWEKGIIFLKDVSSSSSNHQVADNLHSCSGVAPKPCRYPSYPSIIQPCRWCRVLRNWIPDRFTKHVEILIYIYYTDITGCKKKRISLELTTHGSWHLLSISFSALTHLQKQKKIRNNNNNKNILNCPNHFIQADS